jgi:hypothetical protein
MDPDLTLVVKRWPTLPEAVRRQVVELVQTANVGKALKGKPTGSE